MFHCGCPTTGSAQQGTGTSGDRAQQVDRSAASTSATTNGGTPKDGAHLGPQQTEVPAGKALHERSPSSRDQHSATASATLEDSSHLQRMGSFGDYEASDDEPQPTPSWSDIMELRQLIRQYEQCLAQERRDELLLRKQNDVLAEQVELVRSANELQANLQEVTHVEYMRNVFRKICAGPVGELSMCCSVGSCLCPSVFGRSSGVLCPGRRIEWVGSLSLFSCRLS